MTRFARARGSKASNEKLPEEATSWAEMKKQLRESKCETNEDLDKGCNNESNINNETCKKKISSQRKWENFDEGNVLNKKAGNKVKKNNLETGLYAKLHKNLNSSQESIQKESSLNGNSTIIERSDGVENNYEGHSKNGERNKRKLNDSDIKYSSGNKKFKKKGYCWNTFYKCYESGHSKVECTEGIPTDEKAKVQGYFKKNKGNNAFTHIQNIDDPESKTPTDEEAKFSKFQGFSMKKEDAIRLAKLKKEMNNNGIPQTEIDATLETESRESKHSSKQHPKNNGNYAFSCTHNREDSKSIETEDGKLKFQGYFKGNSRNNAFPHKHSVDDPESKFPMDEEAKFSKCLGFSMKKEDAIRLAKLKKQMKDNGISQTEIDATLKMEKPEHSFTQIKNVSCYRCQTRGHSLAECPENGWQGGTFCFKCGSTEHVSRNCKKVKSDSYKYAECFICKEKGHITKQCPDNPKGVYLNGGSCNACGDVTHLRKDCPQLIKKRESRAVTVGTFQFSSVEGLEDEMGNNASNFKNNVIKKRKGKVFFGF